MKSLFVLALLAVGVSTASAQSGSTGNQSGAAQRASTNNRDTPAGSPVNATPNTSPARGQRTDHKINTAPATGANRASRSSSTTKSTKQGGAIGSSNIESISKSANNSPAPKK